MLTAILGVFAGIGLIIKFIKNFLVKYLVHGVIISAQFAITATTILFIIAFYGFAITALVTVYNLGLSIFDYATTSTSGLVSCLFGLLSCIGFADALQIGFSLMYSALGTIVIFHLFKFTFSAMRIIMNEVFKLGVLIGQALK